MKRVLILNASQRSALAVTRSLGKRGIAVVTADETDKALAGTSRYSQQYFCHPSPQQQPELFFSAVRDICLSENIGMIIPMTELTVGLLLSRKDELPGIILPFAGLDTVDTVSNKCSLMRLADTLDIPVPTTWQVNPDDDLTIDLAALPYPLILKPGKSWLYHDGQWLHTTVKTARNPAEASEMLTTDPAFHSHPFMLQAFVPGKGEGIFALYNQGRAVAFFAHRRLREKPPQGGVSVLSESTMVNPRLEEYARKLLDHVNWHGVAMVEFRMTKDGQPYLMEINTRFWGSLQLSVDAGVDFPWLLYQIATGQDPGRIENYRTERRLRWLLGDLDALYITLKGGDFSPAEKLAAIGRFFLPRPFITRHEVNRLDDIKPFFREIRQYLSDLEKP